MNHPYPTLPRSRVFACNQSRCIRCGHWWTFDHPVFTFQVITRWCPDCVALMPKWGAA